jgi:hypothetical protein
MRSDSRSHPPGFDVDLDSEERTLRWDEGTAEVMRQAIGLQERTLESMRMQLRAYEKRFSAGRC